MNSKEDEGQGVDGAEEGGEAESTFGIGEPTAAEVA